MWVSLVIPRREVWRGLARTREKCLWLAASLEVVGFVEDPVLPRGSNDVQSHVSSSAQASWGMCGGIHKDFAGAHQHFLAIDGELQAPSKMVVLAHFGDDGAPSPQTGLPFPW